MILPIEKPSSDKLRQSIILAYKIFTFHQKTRIAIPLSQLKAELDYLKEENIQPYLQSLEGHFHSNTDYNRWRLLVHDIDFYTQRNQEHLGAKGNNYVFKNAITSDIWRLIFSQLTKIDLAMLEQANKFFYHLLSGPDGFKKTTNYAQLRTDDSSYLLTPIESIFLPAFKDKVYEIEAIKSGEFLISDGGGHNYHICDCNDKAVHYPLGPVFQTRNDIFIRSVQILNENEILLCISNRTIQIWRRNPEGKFSLFQTAPTDYKHNYFSVINNHEFLTIPPRCGSASCWLWQKDKDNSFKSIEINISGVIYFDFVADENEILFYSEGQDPVQHKQIERIEVMRRNGSTNKFHKEQEIDDVGNTPTILKINNRELALLDFFKEKMTFLKKNHLNLYECIGRLDLAGLRFPGALRLPKALVIKDDSIICFGNGFIFMRRDQDGLFQISQSDKSPFGIENFYFAAKLPNNQIFFATTGSFQIWYLGDDGVMRCAHAIKVPELITNDPLVTISSSGEIIEYGHSSTCMSYFFPSLERIIKKFHAPRQSPKDILTRIQNAILLNEQGLPQQWNDKNFSFWRRHTVVVNDKSKVKVHSVMNNILLHIKTAKKEIAKSPKLSTQEQDSIYRKAIDKISEELSNKSMQDDIKDKKIEASFYLWQKLITNFQRNWELYELDMPQNLPKF